jgi:CRP/FNR family cyclic AMP-dependent transcriptional regulator
MQVVKNDTDTWGLSPETLDRFLGFCEIQSRPKNHVLTRPGDCSGDLMYMISGEVTVFAMEEGERELTLGEFRAGDFIGEIGIFFPTGPRGVYIRAKTAVEYAEISATQFKKLMRGALAKEAANLLFAIGAQLSRRLLETRRKASSLALMDVETRIRRALWEIHAELPHKHSEGPAVRISRKDLASRVGCTREVSGRVIKRLADQGWLADHGKVLVLLQH